MKRLLLLPLCLMLSACSHLSLDYEFNTGQTFTTILTGFSEKTLTSYKGYVYYFDTWPDNPSLPWGNAKLHSPVNINGGNDTLQCWNQTFPDFIFNRRFLEFYCGSASAPATPPAGTYQVNVTPKTFVINGVTPRTIPSDLIDIYVPSVKLTMSGGQITRIEWQWWKKTSTGWIQPPDSELASQLESAEFEIARSDWAVSSRVHGKISMTTNGNVVPSAQSFTPSAFRISYLDRSGYHYGFEWR